MNEYQQHARETALGLSTGERADSPLGGLVYNAVGLADEAGEFLGKVKKAWRDGAMSKEAMAAELGDVLWYLAMCCETLGYDLQIVAESNVIKLRSRADRGALQGTGDDR